MKILVTGAAGFIGFHLCKSLLENGHEIIGLDNINDYYDVSLKYARLKELSISKNKAESFLNIIESEKYGKAFRFIRMNLEDRENLPKLFSEYKFDVVCNLAAQAGVRYSIENPETYIDSNVVGFLNILECCRKYQIKKLVYASSSSVYGNSKKIPFKEIDNVDNPISLYAATKKTNELMAHTYSHLYDFETIGLRFFTVYGPWGRPDMAMFLFVDAILNDKEINVFNNGNLSRDFTYIDDIIEGITTIMTTEKENIGGNKKYSLYNIGNSKPIQLLDFIKTIEKETGKKAKKKMKPMQAGDVDKTYANVDQLMNDYDYKPKTSISYGVKQFVNWYKKINTSV